MYSNKYFLNSFLHRFFVFILLPFGVMAQVAIKTNDKSILYADQSASRQGSISIQNGGATWSGATSMRWNINVTAAGNYKFFIQNAVSRAAEGMAMRISSQSGSTLNFALRQTFGIPQGWERDTIAGTLALPAGSQWIELGTAGTPTGTVMGLRGLEIYPAAAEAAMAATTARAKAARPNTDWMLRAKYGLMFHWNPLSVDQNNNLVPYATMVRNFNVSAFANMVKETGAGYVLFTFTHGGNTAPAPLTTWNGPTTQRDLIMEIADSLNTKGIKLMLYGGQWALNIMTELGTRYGEKVSGYWFDGGWTTTHNNPNYDSEAFYRACKAGNPNRVIALNYWVYPNDTEWQDYWAGEVAGLATIPSSRYATEGPIHGLQSHMLILMEDNWWMDSNNERTMLSRNQLSPYVTRAMGKGVAVTINVMIYPDGTILPSSMAVLKGLSEDVRNVQPVVSVAPGLQQETFQGTIMPGFRALVINGTGNQAQAVIYTIAGRKVHAFSLHPGKNVVRYGDLPLAPGSHIIKVKEASHRFLVPW